MKLLKRIWVSIFIPKHTIYCYSCKKRFKPCRYWEELEEKDEYGHNKYYCKYLKLKDDYQGDTLLWDMCKECGVNDDYE